MMGLTGWGAVTAIALVLLAVMIATSWLAMRGLMRALAVVVLSFPAMWLLAKYVFGDVSVYFPHGTFSDGADGKDQIIMASLLCTVLGGVIVAGCLVGGIVWLDRLLNRRRLRKPV